MSGPGDVIAGLAPEQDNGPPAAAYRRGGWLTGSAYTKGGQRTGLLGEVRETPSPQEQQSTTQQVAGNITAPINPPSGPNPDAPSQPGAATDTGIPGALAGYIRTAWSRNKRARDRIEYRMLACLRARRGEYDAVELADMWTADAGEPIYLPIAATKMRAAEAALRDLILPDGDRPWGFEADPDPELPADLELGIKQQAYQAAQQKIAQLKQQMGKVVDMTQFVTMATEIQASERAKAIAEQEKQAKIRAERMEDTVEKRLIRGNYNQAMSEFLQHFCTYPAAVLKGPFLRREKRQVWNKKGWVMHVESSPQLYWCAVNPFDCYPAPEAESCQDGDFIERIRMTRADLYECIGVPGYDEQAIRRCLSTHESGGLRGWLWSDMERRQLEGNTFETWQPEYLVDAIHYWGSVQGTTLMQHGISIGEDGDPLAYYEVDAILIGNEIIRCEINDDPLGRRPYHNASYDPVPGAFWGNSIYDLMRDCQAMVNACARSLNANLGLASGPIMGIDVSQLAAGEDPKAMRPLQQIQLDRSRAQAQADPITFYQADSRSTDLLKVMGEFEIRADDLTGIPRYMYGNTDMKGGAATSSGLSMLMGTAAKGLRRACANIDRGVIAPTIEATYNYEMMYGNDDDAKGAATVVARGSMAIIIKEHLQQVRQAFLQDVDRSPIAQKIIGIKGYASVLREQVKVLDMNTDEVVPDDEALDEMIKNQPPPQPSPDEQLKSQTSLKREQMKNTTALVKEGLIHPEAGAALAAAGQNNAPNNGTVPNAQPTAANG